MKKYSSKPRAVVVTFIDDTQALFGSVSECARCVGLSRENVHSKLSGRSGKRCDMKFEYLDGDIKHGC